MECSFILGLVIAQIQSNRYTHLSELISIVSMIHSAFITEFIPKLEKVWGNANVAQ
jgi:hypothetical protein